jgi:hypothetical protein
MMSDTQVHASEAPDDDAPVEVADKPREPTPYEKKLRTEARQHRLARVEAERLREEGIAAARSDADARIAAANATANERIIRAELKAHAVKAGIVDLDGLRLLDVSKARMNDAGEVEGAEALIGELRTAKPYLFGGASSSSTAKPPAEQVPSTKKAKEMTQDEWRAARAAIIKRR